MTLEGLVTEQGPLAETFQKLDPNTIQYAFEITKERRGNLKLRKQGFWTADSSLYRVEDDDAVLYFGNRDTNLIFKNIEEATKQLIKTGNYVPPKADIEAVVKAESTLRIKLLYLGLKGENDEWQYLEIDTSDYYDTLKIIQRALAERVYGQGKDFVENMKMLADVGVKKTKIYVLNPEYVRKHITEDGAIVRASRLGVFELSGFDAGGSDVGIPSNALRGVYSIAEGDAQTIIDVYNLLKSPVVAARAAQMLTPETAAGLSNVLTRYLANAQKQ